MENKDKLSYSIRELEASSGLSKSKIYNLINEGSLSALNCAGKTIVTAAEYQRLLASLPRIDLKAKRKAGSTAKNREPAEREAACRHESPPSSTRRGPA
jgi:hypothetical protein